MFRVRVLVQCSLITNQRKKSSSWIRNGKSRRYFYSKLQQGDEETRVIFLCRGKLKKFKQKEMNRLPAFVTTVGMPVAKDIE